MGQRAPNFRAESLDGQTVALADFRGQPVLVNFWATWCLPCRVEMPLLAQAPARYGADLVVLAVDVQESLQAAASYATASGLALPMLADTDGTVAALYRVRALPTTFVVDRSGVVVRSHRGAITSAQVLADLLAPVTGASLVGTP